MLFDKAFNSITDKKSDLYILLSSLANVTEAIEVSRGGPFMTRDYGFEFKEVSSAKNLYSLIRKYPSLLLNFYHDIKLVNDNLLIMESNDKKSWGVLEGLFKDNDLFDKLKNNISTDTVLIHLETDDKTIASALYMIMTSITSEIHESPLSDLISFGLIDKQTKKIPEALDLLPEIRLFLFQDDYLEDNQFCVNKNRIKTFNQIIMEQFTRTRSISHPYEQVYYISMKGNDLMFSRDLFFNRYDKDEVEYILDNLLEAYRDYFSYKFYEKSMRLNIKLMLKNYLNLYQNRFKEYQSYKKKIAVYRYVQNILFQIENYMKFNKFYPDNATFKNSILDTVRNGIKNTKYQVNRPFDFDDLEIKYLKLINGYVLVARPKDIKDNIPLFLYGIDNSITVLSGPGSECSKVPNARILTEEEVVEFMNKLDPNK